jgi:hypothetical protein|tara:strand:- start:2799 stop:3035 length:237 start_codon:yes stop_codon:yes gene_type:complete
MNYDNWKLDSPQYNEIVSSCCGSQYVLSIDFENDIETENKYLCNNCKTFCEVIKDYEYDQNKKDDYYENLSDEIRLNQ